MKKKASILSGPIGRNMIIFAVPVILTGILQSFYNMADVMVVGRFAGKESLAAVGSTGPLTNLFINLFIGLSSGASVCVAQRIGADDKEGIEKSVHTAVALSIVSGIFIAILGILTSKRMLIWMDAPTNVLDEAALYMKILFLGMSFNLVYNFGAEILRASGDTKHPLIFLAIAGAVNVVLNLVLVIAFHLGAAGVGIATSISQFLSCIMVLWFLAKKSPVCQLRFKKIRLHFSYLLRILRIGIPAGLQGMVFSFSNVMVQSSVNGFGDIVVAAKSSAGNIDSFVYTSMNGMAQAMIPFVGQNVGAGNWKRIKKIILTGCLQVTILGIACSSLIAVFKEPLLALYTPGETEIIAYGSLMLRFILPLYFCCGLMDTLVCAQRGMGTSLAPMLVAILGVCGVRLGWIFTVFAAHKSLEVLYLSYPVSWVLTATVQAIFCTVVYKNMMKRVRTEELQ